MSEFFVKVKRKGRDFFGDREFEDDVFINLNQILAIGDTYIICSGDIQITLAPESIESLREYLKDCADCTGKGDSDEGST